MPLSTKVQGNISGEFFHGIDAILIEGKTFKTVLRNGHRVIFVFPQPELINLKPANQHEGWTPQAIKCPSIWQVICWRGCHEFAEVMASVSLRTCLGTPGPWEYIFTASWVITNVVQKRLKDWSHVNQQQWGKAFPASEEWKVIQQLLREIIWTYDVNKIIWNSEAI